MGSNMPINSSANLMSTTQFTSRMTSGMPINPQQQQFLQHQMINSGMNSVRNPI